MACAKWVSVWLVASAVCVLRATAGEAVDLKVTRVAVFSSGVGFYECSATVTDDATAELKFRTDQVNDILKSLVVQDLDGGTIGTVAYASRDPIGKTLKSFAVDITGKPPLGQLLDQLRGEPVEIAAPARMVKGVIVGVEKQKLLADKNVIETDMLNVLTDRGIEQFRLGELQGIRLTNEKVDAELRKALTTLATSHDADKKSVVLHFNGRGQRRVTASYLLEAPIWKTSYRLVLAPDRKPFLQGWATVENATEEDWNNVRLSLVSGRPISFRMDLYTPLYVPRPVEELEIYASLRPPEYLGAFGKAMPGTPETPAAAPMTTLWSTAGAATPGPRRQTPAEAGKDKDGRVPERMNVHMRLADSDGQDLAVAAPRPESLSRSVESVAKAEAAGELFEYAIAAPVSIARQRSAMLPIVNQEVAGEKISIFNPATHPRHPLNGLQLENATALNLMQGPATVFDDGVYAGDAKLPDLRPGEKRFVAYALDLAVEVMVRQQPRPDELVSLKIAKGVLWHRHKYVDERTYVLKNKDKKNRTVLIEQGYDDDWQLIEPKEPFERAPNLSRFKVAVPAGKTVEQKVAIQRVADEAMALGDAGFDAIEVYVRSKAISSGVRKALEKVVTMRTEADRVSRDRAAREKEVKESVEEQGRIRENLKTLQQNSDPYQRQLKKFDALETQIEKLRAQVAELRKDEEKKRAALQDYLVSLDVE